MQQCGFAAFGKAALFPWLDFTDTGQTPGRAEDLWQRVATAPAQSETRARGWGARPGNGEPGGRVCSDDRLGLVESLRGCDLEWYLTVALCEVVLLLRRT